MLSAQPACFKQIVFDGVLMVILGIIVAWLYRDSARRAQ
jgi:hypothetical protein